MPRSESRGPVSQPVAEARLQCRRGERISLESVSADALFRLEQGCMTCDVLLASGQRHIMVVLHPGYLICRSLLPPLPNLALSAAVPSVLTRVTLSHGATPDPASMGLRSALLTSTARLLARTTLYATAMGRLSAEERLATLLCDIALHLGSQAAGGFAFEVPLSRRDMADHLALNPDSLSRLMSRFKARGLIALPSRTRAIARDLDALLGATPFGSTLQDMRTASLLPDEATERTNKHGSSAVHRADYSTTRR